MRSACPERIALDKIAVVVLLVIVTTEIGRLSELTNLNKRRKDVEQKGRENSRIVNEINDLTPLILDLAEPIGIMYEGDEQVRFGFTTVGTWNECDSGGTD